jgi:hypothetical protein
MQVAHPILSAILELMVSALISILVDRLFSTKAAIIALCICLAGVGYLHRDQIRPLVSRHAGNTRSQNQNDQSQATNPSPPNAAGSPTAAQIADEVAKRLAGAKTTPKRGEEIYAEVLGATVDKIGQFYQHPPVYFKKLDTGLYVSLTNQSDYQIYLRRYSVSAAIKGKSVRFENPDPDVIEPDAFGIIDSSRMLIARFDLSQNGFDYVMGQHPLGAHENANLWMFFLTGTKDLKELAGTIDKFTITFYDSTNKTYRCMAPFRKGAISRGNRTLPPTTHVDIRFLDAEPIPADLREEPKANRLGP